MEEYKINISADDIEFLMEEYDYDNLDERSWNILENIRFQIKNTAVSERSKRTDGCEVVRAERVRQSHTVIDLDYKIDGIKEQIMDKKDEIMEVVGEKLACCSKVLLEQQNGKILIYEMPYVDL